MTAYYNENDPRMAAVLRVLISEGHIAPGDVDERSISDVKPGDLRGYVQCHFFAGIGVWSYAARCAGWPDDRPIWSGSCPCQPFSPAGKGLGFADERHLWPDWFHLIRECRPSTVVGEQVADRGGFAWFDLVSADMEGAGFAIGAVVAPAASVGAPHMRHRTFFAARRLADSLRVGQSEQRFLGRSDNPAQEVDWQEHRVVDVGGCGGLADTDLRRREQESNKRPAGLFGTNVQPSEPGNQSGDMCATPDGSCTTGPTGGFWRDADWLHGRDGKWRAVEPGTFPLVDGASARVGRLHGYGNAIVAPLATEIIKCLI